MAAHPTDLRGNQRCGDHSITQCPGRRSSAGLRSPEPSEPPLFLLRPEARRRGLEQCRRRVHCRGRDRAHAHGHLEYIEEMDAQAAGKPIGPTGDNLKAAIASEIHEYTDVYPGMARGPPGASPKPKGRR